jgi:hypothetical protein
MAHPEELMLQRLIAANWVVVRAPRGTEATLTGDIGARYKKLPSSYARFLASIEKCVRPSSDAWFLGLPDFTGDSDAAFSWNEFERQSLDAAQGDESWQREISNYWDEVLPIALSVRSGYSYLGLRLSTGDFGSIVLGREPEFEEPTELASSFEDLCEAIVEYLDGNVKEGLEDFV